MKIKHLSIVVQNPKRAAHVLAELSGGRPESFGSTNMQGAWVCLWGGDTDELIEFLPEGYLLHSTELGANFKKSDAKLGYNSTHFQIEVDIPLAKIKEIASKHNCHHYFRPRFGGPLYEVWIEDQCLVEFVSAEITNLAKL